MNALSSSIFAFRVRSLKLLPHIHAVHFTVHGAELTPAELAVEDQPGQLPRGRDHADVPAPAGGNSITNLPQPGVPGQ